MHGDLAHSADGQSGEQQYNRGDDEGWLQIKSFGNAGKSFGYDARKNCDIWTLSPPCHCPTQEPISTIICF